MRPHSFTPSNLGHGETMCQYCFGTNRELAALGQLDHCEKAPPNEPPGNQLDKPPASGVGGMVVASGAGGVGGFGGTRIEQAQTLRAPPVVELHAFRSPEREGFFWARWHTPAPGTADNGECCNPDEWQVCQVFENCLDEASPEHLMVFVPGVERAQPLDAFEWGQEVRRV